MGNNPSKPEGRTASSPATSHSSASTTHSHPHSRPEPKPTVHSSKTSTPQSTSQSQPPPPSQQNHLLSHTHSQSHSHSHSRSHSYSHSQSHPQAHSYSQHSSPTANPPSQRHPPDDRMGNEQSRQKWREKREQTTPVRVPRGAEAKRQRGPDSQFEPSGPPRDPNYIPHSNLNFPPRLPLPIEEEVHTPGSPIITQAGISSALHEDGVEGPLPRQSSGVSSTTIDEDDIGDELRPFSLDDSRRTVPTVVKWKQGGDKVYVTGTFTSWNRKFRMNRE